MYIVTLLGNLLSIISSLITIISFLSQKSKKHTSTNVVHNITQTSKLSKNNIFTSIAEEVLKAIDSFFVDLSNNPIAFIIIMIAIIYAVYFSLLKAYFYIFNLIAISSLVVIIVVLLNTAKKIFLKQIVGFSDFFVSFIWFVLFIILLKHYNQIYLPQSFYFFTTEKYNSTFLTNLPQSINYIFSVILLIISWFINICITFTYLTNKEIFIHKVVFWLSIVIINLASIFGVILKVFKLFK
jgi:hypothetical protein